MKKRQKFLNTKRGFTLLETLVAIIILITGILGPLTLAARSISSASTTRNRIIALNLAEEGMEFIRNKRDTNFIQGNDWLAGLGPCGSANGCRVDFFKKIPGNKDLRACSANCPPLRRNDATKIFSYNNSDPKSIFTRIIFIAGVADYDIPPDGDNDEIKVTVEVTWKERFSNPTLKAEMRLFRWVR